MKKITGPFIIKTIQTKNKVGGVTLIVRLTVLLE